MNEATELVPTNAAAPPETGARREPSQATHGIQISSPALIQALRERVKPDQPCLVGVNDEVLNELVTVVFFAGLEKYEAERHPVRVVFIGTRPLDVILPESHALGMTPIYQWKALRFEVPRPFSVREVVKLAVIGADDRIYTKVKLLDGRLAITGLAREGVNIEGDPFLKFIVPRPGGLSIRSGRERILEYEHGYVITGSEDLLLSTGMVRRGLEEIARAAAVDAPAVPDYLDAIRALLHEMAAHGHGGILVIGPDEDPELPKGAAYRMVPDSSLATLLKLHRLLAPSAKPSEPGAVRSPASRGAAVEQSPSIAFSDLLRGAFLTETERVIKEVGALTAIDGATVLNRNLTVVAFGVTLPVAGNGRRIMEAGDPDGIQRRPFDLGSHGTRHGAGVTYADQHPGSVVFVASQDGPISCMFRTSSHDDVMVWRFGRGGDPSI